MSLLSQLSDKMLKTMKLMLRVYVSERTELSRDAEKN